MNITVRVDASINIGNGHVMRCLVLAKKLSRLGYSIQFACLPQKGDLIAYIRSNGFHVIELTKLTRSVTSRAEDYLSWLQRSVLDDANDFLSCVTQSDLVIVDHYGIDSSWESLVSKQLGCKILAIDDLVRVHNADLILDQTLGRKREDYHESGLDTVIMAGSMYALLDDSFAKIRKTLERRAYPKFPPSILLSMGGVDSPNKTLEVLECLSESSYSAMTVLLSPSAPHYKFVKNWCVDKVKISHVDFTQNMGSLIASHDIAIGAPGVTSYERACLGMPALLLPIASNQEDNCTSFIRAKAAVTTSSSSGISDIDYLISELVDNYNEFSENATAICDGQGSTRVVSNIEELMHKKNIDISLEKATLADCEVVYEWQIHSTTRRFFRNNNKPSWDEHIHWFTNKISESKSYMYISKSACTRTPVGVVRLEPLAEKLFEVSILVSPKYYGTGIAFRTLSALDDIHPDVDFYAEVHPDNIGSKKLFLKSGYCQTSDTEFYKKQNLDEIKNERHRE